MIRSVLINQDSEGRYSVQVVDMDDTESCRFGVETIQEALEDACIGVALLEEANSFNPTPGQVTRGVR